jgi:hypothetical protein
VFMTTSSSSNSWRWRVEICHHCKAIDMQWSHRCFLTIVTFQDTMNLPTGHSPWFVQKNSQSLHLPTSKHH